ncbi:MAG: hypothetical protein OWR52_03545 [Acidibacillus sp.]|nr:hypothetical protein [Acidibacillus sp.]
MFVPETDGLEILFSARVHGKRLATNGSLTMIEITYEEHGIAEMHVHP